MSFGHFSIQHIVNDGLMTIFFLLVGLELEREIYVGELSNIRKALLPIIAAIGGMIFPALIHYVFNAGTITQSGAGIPTATDIAFSLAVLSIFSKKVPNSLKIFLTALAIADDLGAVFVIGIFYTKTIFWGNLAIALSIFFLLLLFNKFKVKSLAVYLLFGFAMWFFMLNSGIHATISGVMLAFTIPFTKENNISFTLQHKLHKPVALFILPLFALVNTSIFIGNDWANNLFSANSLGVFFGLVLGKPIGILFVTFLAITFKVAKFPSDISWVHIIGASLLAGIGFTMSIFVSGLAFEDATTIQFSQISVLIASTVAALLGMLWFYFFVKKKPLKN
jgi:NhaA family Na+:H+ antiporter